jgi:DNA-binding NarL/FixJ family response regulator
MNAPIAKVRRVVIVDDSRTSQVILEAAFHSQGGLEIVGVACDAPSGFEMVRKLGPDIVSIDLCMPYIDGSALLEMLAPFKGVCKLILSDQATSNVLLASKLEAAGASICLSKSELANQPASFFRKLLRACEKIEDAGWRDVPLLTLTSDSEKRSGVRVAKPPVHVGIPIPFDEEARLADLQRKGLANAVRERQFDLVTRFVAEETDFPVCLMTFIDRDTQWIKSAYGYDAASGPRSDAFCNYTIAGGKLFVVANAETDARFATNPMVTGEPHFRTYAGQPIVSAEGVRLGALCILDTKVRAVTPSMTRKLAFFSDILSSMIEGRQIPPA